MSLFDKFKNKKPKVEPAPDMKPCVDEEQERRKTIEQQLAALYNKLAKHIVAMIPVKWSEFHYLGEIEKGKQSYSSVFYFKDASSGEFVKSNNMPKIYQIPQNSYMIQWTQLNNILLEIYDCFADNGQAPWEQMSFSVDQSEKFKVNYLYDVMNDQDGGQVVRELIWARDTFGYVPKEGTPARKILDRYLKK